MLLKANIMPKLIEEVFGIDTNRFNADVDIDRSELNQNINFNQKSGLHNFDQNRLTSPDPAYQLTNWQKLFKDRVLAKRDTIVAVPPAAGKTPPLLQAWFELLVGAVAAGVSKNSPSFPRILYIAKTKQLATENRIQNFIGNDKIGLFAFACKHPHYFIPRLHALPSEDRVMTPLTNQEVQEIYKQINGMVGFLTGGISFNSIKNNDYVIKPIIVSTPLDNENSSIVSLIKSYSKWFSIIVIDEFQEYIPKPTTIGFKDKSFNEDDTKNFNLVKGIIYNAQKSGQCGIQILTGTVNKNTLNVFKDEVNKQFKRSFDVICEFNDTRLINGLPNPDFAANRSIVKIVPFEKMKNLQQLRELVINIVKAKQANSVMVIFSVNRDTAKGIFRLAEDVLSKLPARYQTTPINSASDIKTRKLTYGSSIDSSHPALSGNKLNNPTLNKLKDTFAGNYIHPDYEEHLQPDGLETTKVSDIEFLKYFDINEVETGIKSKAVVTYEGNILYQSILRGVGIMVGKMPDRYKAIIQKLFRDKKIYIILATDSLGIGANVLAQHLYIPDLGKAGKDENENFAFEPLDASTLIQLINRAGRDSSNIPYATIYCALKDCESIEQAVKADPSIYTQPLDPDIIKKKLNETQYLQFLWNKINGQST
jgi:hypothetical protein